MAQSVDDWLCGGAVEEPEQKLRIEVPLSRAGKMRSRRVQYDKINLFTHVF
jgi:hypothetical protein